MALKHQIVDDEDKSNSASGINQNQENPKILEQEDDVQKAREDECFQEEQTGQEYRMRGLLEQQVREEALGYIASCEISEEVVSDSINHIEEEVHVAAENTSTNITQRRHHLLKDLLLSDNGGGSFAPTASSPPQPQPLNYDCHSEGIAWTSEPEATTSDQQHNWKEDLEKHEELPLGSLAERKGSGEKSKWRGKMEGIFGMFTNLIRKQPTPIENYMSEIYKQSNLRAKLESDRKKNNSSKDKQCWSQLTCCKLDVEVIKCSKRKQQNEQWKSHLEEYISSDTW